MNAATSAELARLGVPFFALDSALICVDDDEQTKKEKEEKGEGEHGGKISRGEAEELKIRMLTLLQDLCRE